MAYDVIVIGAGGMGSAAADALAGRGQRVLALDRFGAATERGSSHGRTRIIRQAYFESPAYIPLLRRAYQLWDGFPAACGIRRVGCLMLGPAASPVVVGAALSARQWGIAVESLTAAEVRTRYPAFAPGEDDVAVLEPGAGFVRPEDTLRFLASRAQARGAELRRGVRVTGWDLTREGVRVSTAEDTVTASRLVLATGAFSASLPGPVTLPVRPERRVMHFFAPGGDAERSAPGRMPTFIWDLAAGDAIYGFPADGADGVKVGFHHRGGPADPDSPQPPGSPAEVAAMAEVLASRLPAAGRHLRSVGCLYELTPDHDSLLGLVPGCASRVVAAAGFSGHGFKFVPVVGEVVADLVTTGDSAFDLGFLSPARLLT